MQCKFPAENVRFFRIIRYNDNIMNQSSLIVVNSSQEIRNQITVPTVSYTFLCPQFILNKIHIKPFEIALVTIGTTAVILEKYMTINEMYLVLDIR